MCHYLFSHCLHSTVQSALELNLTGFLCLKANLRREGEESIEPDMQGGLYSYLDGVQGVTSDNQAHTTHPSSHKVLECSRLFVGLALWRL